MMSYGGFTIQVHEPNLLLPGFHLFQKALFELINQVAEPTGLKILTTG